MKELFVQLSAYHSWANQLLTDIINTLPEEQQRKELPSSFSSVFLTMVHMWEAEHIWWQRMKLVENVKPLGQGFNGNTKELSAKLLEQNQKWQQWISMATEPMLAHEFKYQNSKKEGFKQPVYQMLLHLFNHGTYHRGQLVNMLRQLGIEKIPQTDFIVWSRKKGLRAYKERKEHKETY